MTANLWGYCFIYFSSNSLYKKDDYDSFKQQILEEDKYEWSHYSVMPKPAKEIYIRDIWLSWYAKGINHKLNNIQKVIDFLRKECKGYTIVTVGVSSGAYMAMITGCMLHAKRCFCICGQVSLMNHIFDLNERPILKKYYDEKWSECYHLLDDNKDINIIYMYPAYVEHDVIQSKFLVGKENVYDFKFDLKTHGCCPYTFNWPLLLSATDKKLYDLYKTFQGKLIERNDFSAELGGETRIRKG